MKQVVHARTSNQVLVIDLKPEFRGRSLTVTIEACEQTLRERRAEALRAIGFFTTDGILDAIESCDPKHAGHKVGDLTREDIGRKVRVVAVHDDDDSGLEVGEEHEIADFDSRDQDLPIRLSLGGWPHRETLVEFVE